MYRVTRSDWPYLWVMPSVLLSEGHQSEWGSGWLVEVPILDLKTLIPVIGVEEFCGMYGDKGNS